MPADFKEANWQSFGQLTNCNLSAIAFSNLVGENDFKPNYLKLNIFTMDFLKNRNYLSLTAFLLVSFMLVFASCGKENVPSVDKQTQTSIIESIITTDNFTLPFGMTDLDETEFTSFMESISALELKRLQKNYTLKMFLIQVDKLELVEEHMSDMDLYIDMMLTSLLSEDEVSQLKEFDSNSLEGLHRICATNCTHTRTTCIYGHGCVKAKFKVYKCRRDCTSSGSATWTSYQKSGCC